MMIGHDWSDWFAGPGLLVLQLLPLEVCPLATPTKEKSIACLAPACSQPSVYVSLLIDIWWTRCIDLSEMDRVRFLCALFQLSEAARNGQL